MSERTRINLRQTITDVRSARDNAARAAERCARNDASGFATELEELAARLDRDLARLLAMDESFDRTMAGTSTAAGKMSPAAG